MRHAVWCLILVFLIGSPTGAGEVDPFSANDKQIKDSKSLVNTYLNREIIRILKTYRKRHKKHSSCEDVSLHIMRNLGTRKYGFIRMDALNSALELWVVSNREIDRIPGYGYEEDAYDCQSIYAPKLKFFGIWPKAVDPTININGVYFGTDKLSHFLGSGYEYFSRYLDKKSKGMDDYGAQLYAIRWGVMMEKTILGLWPVGVFSFADLEANYQGFLMAKDLCDQGALQYKNGAWELVRKIQFQHYVNPDWDEAYNPNSYSESRQKEIRKNIVQFHKCESLNWSNYYKRQVLYEKKIIAESSSRNIEGRSLSSSLMKMLSTKKIAQRTRIYHEILKAGYQGWSYQKIHILFRAIDSISESYLLENFCRKNR